MRRVADIEIGLVQRQRLDQIGELAKDGVDLTGNRAIGLETWFDDQQVRTQLQRMSRGHRRAHTIRPRLVVAGGDHPTPISRTAHRQRAAGQARVVAHLDCRIEAVAVDVDNFSLAHRASILRACPHERRQLNTALHPCAAAPDQARYARRKVSTAAATACLKSTTAGCAPHSSGSLMPASSNPFRCRAARSGSAARRTCCAMKRAR